MNKIILLGVFALALGYSPSFAADGGHAHKGAEAAMQKAGDGQEALPGEKSNKKTCACCAGGSEEEVSAKAPGKAAYVCPMGCAESDKPGKCPKCGMDMKENKAAMHKAYACPMGCVKSKKPGKCPKCGMAMKEVKEAKEPSARMYVCPMGDYQGDKPGKCPKCGMTLVEKK